MRKCILAGAVVSASLGIWACDMQDPSAMEEIQRLKAELAASQRETEVVREQIGDGQKAVETMRAQLQEAAAKLEQAVAAKVPTPQELHQRLAQEMFGLQKQAEAQLPDYNIREVSFGNVQVPSLEYPFSCQVTMTLADPAGRINRVYFKGKGSPAGEWSFDQIDPAEAQAPVVASSGAGAVAPVAGQSDAAGQVPPVASTETGTPPVVEPATREKTRDELLEERASRRGAMKADQTIIIDPSKMQPLNIPAH